MASQHQQHPWPQQQILNALRSAINDASHGQPGLRAPFGQSIPPSLDRPDLIKAEIQKVRFHSNLVCPSPHHCMAVFFRPLLQNSYNLLSSPHFRLWLTVGIVACSSASPCFRII